MASVHVPSRSGEGRTQSPARSAASSVFSGPATLPAPSSGSSSLSARLVGSNPSTETGEGTPTVRPPLAEPTEPAEPTELTERSPPRSLGCAGLSRASVSEATEEKEFSADTSAAADAALRKEISPMESDIRAAIACCMRGT